LINFINFKINNYINFWWLIINIYYARARHGQYLWMLIAIFKQIDRFIPNNFLGTSENMLEKYVFLLVPTLLSLIPSEHDTCAVLLNEGRPNVQSRQEIIMKSTDSCYDVAMACMLARSKTMHASSILIRQQGLVFEPRDSKAITIHAHVLGEAVLLFL